MSRLATDLASFASTQRGRGAAWLLAVQRHDGSWGYRPDRVGYVEPTALAVLALLRETPRGSEVELGLKRALEWLRGTQRADGSWGISPVDDSASWMTAYAVWALSAADAAGYSGEIERGLRWLLAEVAPPPLSEPELAELRRIGGIDGRLVGWAWLPGDAYWVFPTSIGVVASCLAGQRAAPRVRQGLDLLRDRACEGGGWNIGNPSMLDKAFAPTVIDTAAALLALRAAGWDGTAEAAAGRTRLAALVRETTSPLGLAWGALALSDDGAAADEIRQTLAALQQPDGSWLGNPFATALAILALGDAPLLPAGAPS